MKKNFLLVAALLSSVALCCKQEETDPLKLAISDAIKERNVQLETLQISNLEVTDSVSFEEELDRRIALFRTKEKAERRMVDKCLAGNAPAKAQAHNMKAEQAKEIMDTLTQWRISAGRDMDSTLYYIATFYASGKMYDGAELKPTPMKASFDASNKVYNVSDSKSNIHTGMGVTIPGYKTLLEELSIEKEEEEERPTV